MFERGAKTGFPIIVSTIAVPTLSDSFTFTPSLATIPVMMSLRELSYEKSIQVERVSLTFFQIIMITFHPCFCYFSVLRADCVRLLNSCMALLYSDVDMVHYQRISSVIPLPCVKLPELFNDLINMWSMTKSELRPAQN